MTLIDCVNKNRNAPHEQVGHTKVIGGAEYRVMFDPARLSDPYYVTRDGAVDQVRLELRECWEYLRSLEI